MASVNPSFVKSAMIHFLLEREGISTAIMVYGSAIISNHPKGAKLHNFILDGINPPQIGILLLKGDL